MYAGKKRSYYYHSCANALGGVIRQPLNRVFSSDASVALPAAGGFVSRRSERFHVDDLISIESAHVRVSGSEDREAQLWRSVSTSVIEGLNILDIFTADRIVAQVAIDHPFDPSLPVRFSLLGSRYENLQVHRSLVIPTLDRKVFGAGWESGTRDNPPEPNAPLSFDEILQVAREQFENRREVAIPEYMGVRLDYNNPDRDLAEKGSALCSLVQEATAEAPIESFGPTLHVPDVGNVFLGEMMFSRKAGAKLTMLRVELGCIADADVSVCSAITDGRGAP